MLDEITTSFRSSHVKFQTWSTRRKALKLVRWLRAQNFTGVQDPGKDYRNLRNCLIGQALRHPDHESIPIISTAIFCCVASRLGIDARSCSFPTHVHAVVYPPASHTLDDDPVAESDSTPQRMFLDPYGNDNEVQLSHLQTTLARLGLQGHAEQFLVPVPASKMAMRTAQNIRAALGVPGLQNHLPSGATQLLRGNNTMNADACSYAASWALLMLSPPNNTTWLVRLAKFLRRFPDCWPEDVWLVEKYLWPRYCSVVNNPRDGFPRNIDTDFGNPWHFWQYVRDADGMAPLIRRRENCIDPRGPKLQVGQVFRHRRYGWLGAITSWHEKITHTDLVNPGLEDPDSASPGGFNYTVCFMCM
jgi:F-box protein 21